MAYDTILYEQDGPILTITLNRPEKLNAYVSAMGQELTHAFNRADEDDSVRAIIVTGAGRGFCAGADISGGAGAFDTKAGGGNKLLGGGLNAEGKRQGGGGFIQAMFACRKPSIAAFNGPAVGVGITLALPLDIKIASTEARFGFVFARRGLVPEAGSAWFLPRLVGLGQALRWCLSGKVFGADEALKGGLVSEVVPPDQLLARAREIATEIATETSAISVALTRQMLWRLAGQDLPDEALDLDGRIVPHLGSSPDVHEGVAAFLEKRKPNFPGKPSQDMPPAYPWWTKA